MKETNKNIPTIKVGDVVKAYHEKDDCIVEGTVLQLIGDAAFVMRPNTGLRGVDVIFMMEDIVE